MVDLEVTIDRLAGLGDGVAETPSGRLHVPLTAPGDRARIALQGRDRGELLEVLNPGPARVTPPCRHFGRCGGCALQHLEPGFVTDWKRAVIAGALSRAQLDGKVVAPTMGIPPGTRRRVTLAARRLSGRVILGFAERRSHHLVDLAECPLIVPVLAAAIPALRQASAGLLEKTETADIAMTATETGIDLILVRPRPLKLPDREGLASLAETLDLARISWRPSMSKPAEPVAVRRTPCVRLGERLVPLPPSGFLQPSVEGQDALIGLIREGLAGVAGPIVDLFCGIGTFALPLAAQAPVTAYDSDAASITGLMALPGKPVRAFRRDLFREPVTPTELAAFAAAIMDPARAGAESQATALAASDVERIAYASCNPVSFARDAAILENGGYDLIEVTPVDQFAWSPHIELVGIFTRG
jgi:23S rRNA (uracil1939-C5)-methyltransferase